MMKPKANLFLIGAAKSGTTSLAADIGQASCHCTAAHQRAGPFQHRPTHTAIYNTIQSIVAVG